MAGLRRLRSTSRIASVIRSSPPRRICDPILIGGISFRTSSRGPQHSTITPRLRAASATALACSGTANSSPCIIPIPLGRSPSPKSAAIRMVHSERALQRPGKRMRPAKATVEVALARDGLLGRLTGILRIATSSGCDEV